MEEERRLYLCEGATGGGELGVAFNSVDLGASLFAISGERGEQISLSRVSSDAEADSCSKPFGQVT